MISIIIPVFNQEKQFDRCLRAIKAQTVDDYEIIVVNDGSSDDSQAVIERWDSEFEAGRYQYQNQPNQGAPSARNAGARYAQGQYLFFCDADIILVPDALATMLKTLTDHPDAVFAYSNFRYGIKIFRFFPFDAVRLKEMPYIHTSSLLRREYYPGWDESLRKLQDWDLWLTVVEHGGRGIWIDRELYTMETGFTMSSWVPKSFHKFLPFLPAVKRYHEAMAIVKKKHGIV